MTRAIDCHSAVKEPAAPHPDRIVAIIPAHNEEATLPQTIESLLTQSRPPDRIVVASDNSTDATVSVARSWGAKVELFETRDNRHKKAGALNQALEWVQESDETWVLVMDADSQLVPEFLATAIDAARQPDVGAVGGIFVGDNRNGLLGALQNLEYVRYAREIARLGANARVLTGTATLIRRGTLREIAQARDEGRLPGSGAYNIDALTEDFCLTVAVKSLGYRCVSPKGCIVITETMGTVGALWRQRIRWQRGALQTLTTYGVNRTTLPYMLRQIEMGFGLMMYGLLLAITAYAVIEGVFAVHPFWMALGVVFQAERLVSGWRAGWKGRVIAGTMFADVVFDLFIGVVYIACIVKTALRMDMEWGIASIDSRNGKVH